MFSFDAWRSRPEHSHECFAYCQKISQNICVCDACVCVRARVCMFACAWICVSASLHTFMHARVRVAVYVQRKYARCARVCVCVPVCKYMCTCKRVCVCERVRQCVRACVSLCVLYELQQTIITYLPFTKGFRLVEPQGQMFPGKFLF